MVRLRTWTFTVFAVGLTLCLLRPSYATDVTLAWDEDPLVSGYYVYYKTGSSGEPYDGTGAREGSSPVNVPSSHDENLSDPNMVEFTLHDLSEDEDYFFVVTAYNDRLESPASPEAYIYGPNNIPDPYNAYYNRGWGISSGDLKGFSVLYHNSCGVVPTLGIPSEIPTLEENIPYAERVGVPLNLQPSGISLPAPVTVFMPCPGHSDVSDLGIYYYDNKRTHWVLANDACAPYDILPDAVRWMVPGARS